MVFNSLTFAYFFLIVYSLYLFLGHRWQNKLLLTASCVFYGAWNWKFLFLLFLTGFIDYNVAVVLDRTANIKRKKILLAISIISNLTVLGFFKYFNFFTINLHNLLAWLGINLNLHLLHVILPVGISFYTFQAMSYTIDVYRGLIKPTKNPLDFALFISFFPQLVAGPIERGAHMLPQIQNPRVLRMDWIYEGLYLIFFGLFQKIYIADNLAKLVDPFFNQPGPYNGIQVWLYLYAFAFQIFCDFAGYSNMARGLARLLGFDLMINFNLPYFATNPSDFWQRWHISLSRWLRDYLYIPLSGNRKGTMITFRNLMITMLLGGLWHGASWTFIIWGAYHGFLLVSHKVVEPWFKRYFSFRNEQARKIWLIVRILFFFHLTCIGWLFFRANSFYQVVEMLNGMFHDLTLPSGFSTLVYSIVGYLFILIVLEIYEYKKDDQLAVFQLKPAAQMSLYLIMFYALLLFGVTTGEKFIYFQF